MNANPPSSPPPAPEGAPPAPLAAPPRLRDRRPVQAQTVTYTSSWLHFLIVVSLLVAWYFPVKFILQRTLWPPAGLDAPRDSYSFVALAYEGVSAKTNEVSAVLFQEQLSALRRAGYVPITLKDVEGLVRDGRPVPRKAVLLTFDHARRTSYFSTHRILRRMGWNAVMFLWTRPIVERDDAALLWPYLRGMIRSGRWEIGAQSHNGLSRVPSGSRGGEGNFMTTPRWLITERRFESLAEFQERLERDHLACIDEIERQLHVRPDAYAYPYGDFGQYQSRAVMTRPVNLGLVEKFYALGFLSGNLAANTRHSDPRRLNRLLVQPEWSGTELVARLDSAWPMEGPRMQAEGHMRPASWIVDWGEMAPQKDGSLTLFAPPTATGAKMWLAGSDLNRDYYVRIKFRLDQGQMGLYFRAAADGESYVYLGVDPQGEVWLRQMAQGRDASALPEDVTGSDAGVWLRQKQVSSERFTLASSRIELQPGQDHTLEVHLRDRLLFAHIDGREVFRSRNLLRGELKPGLFGISVWNPEKGRARVHVSEVALSRQDPIVATWSAKASEPLAFRNVFTRAFRLTHLGPEWMVAMSGGPQPQGPLDLEICRLLARVNHMKLTPQVTVTDEATLPRLSPGLLAEKIAEAGADGIMVNFSDMRVASAATIGPWLRQMYTALEEKKLQLLVALPALLETRAVIQSLLAVAPNASLVVADDAQVRTDPALRTAPMVAEEPLPDEDEELPLFFMIPGAAEGVGVETIEARINRLQQEGLAAYLDGQYARAVEYWKEWLGLEPDSARAMMLIGDATVRLGALNEALEYYRRSLDQDPGQITLAIRYARLLSDVGRVDEAVQTLNLYARLFPENIDILVAQADWLASHERLAEARALAQRILEQQPDVVPALTLLLRLSEPKDPAYGQAMARLTEMISNPLYQLEIGQAIWRYDLGALPGSRELMRRAVEVAREVKDPRVAELYSRFAPQFDHAVESFADGRPSNRWWVEGGSCEGRAGEVRLAAGPSYSEASMRLLGSLHLRHSFVEATLARPPSGSFWLYTSRAATHIARFGYTDDGYLHLQVRKSGRLVADRRTAWTFPSGPVRLRMEAGGDGVMGYVNGEPMFSSRLFMPPDIGLGWVGCSVFSPEMGKAEAVLTGLAAGPVAPRLAALGPVSTPEEADAQLARVRESSAWLHAMCPSWYAVSDTGVWLDLPSADQKMYRIFARYHRLWVLPLVDVRGGVLPPVSELVQRAVAGQVEGFVLVFRAAPDAVVLDALRREAAALPIRLLAVVLLPQGEAELHAFGAGQDFTGGSPQAVRIRLIPEAELRGIRGGPSEAEGWMIGY